MKICGLENTLEKITLDAIKIEDQIKTYKLNFSQIRRQDIEWVMKLPMFVPSFYFYVISKNRIPTQLDYWNAYLSQNNSFFKSAQLSDEQLEGLKARVFRTYPSLVRDLHFGTSLKSGMVFDNVFYNETLDIEYGIDLVVVQSDKMIGLNLYTNTETAVYARTVKEFRPKKVVEFRCLEIPIDFKGSKRCGDFFLYAEREILKIIEEIKKHEY